MFIVKSFKKSKRLEFLQRRDKLFDKVSELSTRNSEARFLSARYELVRLNKFSLLPHGGNKEETEKSCAGIAALIESLEQQVKDRTGVIAVFHSSFEHLSLKDASLVAGLIASVQIVSDGIKQLNDAHLATLQYLEENLPLTKDNLIERNKVKVWQAELELEIAMRQLNEKPLEGGYCLGS